VNDNKEISLMYESVLKNTYVINVTNDISSYDKTDKVSAILSKVNKLISNKENFNDATDLVALKTLKSFIETL
jgi:hypothetical protein